MISFSKFLAEEANPKTEKLNHLDHNEDHIFSGLSGVKRAMAVLHHTHNSLQGKQPSNFRISVKKDGSPSIIFGTNPDNGKHFVASKSALNSNPKINYTPKDVDMNHGHSLGLSNTLKHALKHLPKILPEKGIFQGDVMYTDGAKKDGSNIKFTPNTLTYSVPEKSDHGQKISKSKIGVAVHTRYSGQTLSDMKAMHGVDPKFKEHPDVHIIPTTHDLSKTKYSPAHKTEVENHLKAASDLVAAIHPDAFSHVTPHEEVLKRYINHTVKNGSKPSTSDFKEFLTSKAIDDIAKFKLASTRDRKKNEHTATLKHITDHDDHFSHVFKLHHHLSKAKHGLIKALNTHSEFEHSINGEKSSPEGYVATLDNTPTKLVNRTEFSKANFDKNARH